KYVLVIVVSLLQGDHQDAGVGIRGIQRARFDVELHAPEMPVLHVLEQGRAGPHLVLTDLARRTDDDPVPTHVRGDSKPVGVPRRKGDEIAISVGTTQLANLRIVAIREGAGIRCDGPRRGDTTLGFGASAPAELVEDDFVLAAGLNGKYARRVIRTVEQGRRVFRLEGIAPRKDRVELVGKWVVHGLSRS